MEKLLYARYSNERAPRFSIYTEILSDSEGRRIVRKRADSSRAEGHVRSILRSCEMLRGLYDENMLQINRCEETAEGIELEYLEGETWETSLDTVLEQEGPERFFEEMQRYLRLVLPAGQLQPFRMTEEYRAVFGDVPQAAPDEKTYSSLPVTDVDLIPANVMRTAGGSVLIDYEWTFDFPVPEEYVRYRIVHYYRESNVRRRQLLPEDQYYEMFGLGKENCALWQEAEMCFQKYIEGERIPVRTIYAGITPGMIRVRDLIGEDGDRKDAELQLYVSTGKGFQEDTSRRIPFKGNRICTQIDLPEGTNAVRIDPGDEACLCRIRELRIGEGAAVPAEYVTTGDRLTDDLIAFDRMDPQIILSVEKDDEAGKTLYIDLEVSRPDDKTLGSLRQRFHDTREEMNRLQEENARMRQRLLKIDDNKVYRTLKSVKNMGKKGASEGNLQYYIDSWTASEETVLVRGWALDIKEDVELRITDGKGREVEAAVQWMPRVDIQRRYGVENTRKTGFYARIPKAGMTSPELILQFRAGTRKKQYRLQTNKSNEKEQLPSVRQGLDMTYVKKGIAYLKRNGLRSFMHRLTHRPPGERVDYGEWFLTHRVTEAQLEEQRGYIFALQPKISIAIPLYNTRISFLRALMETILGQSYTNWELCLADGSTNDEVEACIRAEYLQDARIRYIRLKDNFGISGNTNAALELASGDFVMLCDHDDLLEKDALFEIVKRINERPETDVLYTDEDLVDETGQMYQLPRFKPDFDLDMLCSINYICHIFVARKTILDAVGGFRKECDGAQDWDLILRCCERTGHIEHIARILYHWRASESSTAGNPDSKRYAVEAGKKAVLDHYERLGIEAEIEETGIFILFRPLLKVRKHDKVSIIICNKDEVPTLRKCVESILNKSTYDNYEIIIVENNSTDRKTFEYYEQLEKRSDKIRVVRFEGAFNYSKVNNFGAGHADGDYLILLNNDTEVITPDWIERMLGYCQREDVGAVGAKLYYPDKLVQHCGVVVGVGGFAGHILTHTNRGDVGYMGRLQAVMDVSAVTAACMMVKRSVYDEVGGLDEDFRVALNDIDLCMKIRDKGYLIVMHPGVELFHYESKSRGSDETKKNQERFKTEIRRFRTKWKQILEAGDPYYSPHLTLMYGDCQIRLPDEHFDIIDEIEREDRKSLSES